MADTITRLRQARDRAARFAHKHHIGWRILYRIGVYLLLFDVAYVFIFPFLYMIVTSFKSPTDLADITVNWVPRTLQWSNYKLAFTTLQFWPHLRNSLVIGVVAVFGHLASGSFVGYGLARYRFPGGGVIFGLVIVSLIIPTETLIIPTYIMFSRLGLINTFVPILLPTFLGLGLRGGLFIFIFRQFYIRLPHELEDAAKIDGCSFLRTWGSIVVPISQPAVLVSSILGFVWHWHDFYEPSVYLQKGNLMPLPAMLPQLFRLLRALQDSPEMAKDMMENEFYMMFNDAMAMAATVVCLVPVLIIFAVVQRYFIQGVERTGLVE
jgi:multiple sugar transport system permease protein